MNVSLDRRFRLSAPRPAPARLDEATAVAMGAALSAIFFDRPAGRRERMQAEQDGQPMPRPFFSAELALGSGGARHVLFVPQGIATLLSRRLVLGLDGFPVAEIDPDWLQPPQEDLPALTAQLSPQGMRRLLRVMLTTGASLFTGEAQADLAQAILRLLDICDIPALRPVATSRIAGRMLVSYAAPSALGLEDLAEAVALPDGRLIRLKRLDCFAEEKLLHVLLPPGVPAGQILAFPDAPLRLAAPDATLSSLSPPAWLRGRGKPCRDWLARVAGDSAAAPGHEPSAGLAEPKIAIRHLSSTPAGLLHVLVLEDPARVVCKVILEWRGRQAALAPAHGADGTAILAGLTDLPGEAGSGGACRIRALHRSGQLRTLAELPVAAYDGGIPAGFEDAWTLGADALRPLARARAGFRRAAPPSVTRHFGPAKRCGLRIITAIGGSADMIRARAAMILAEDLGAPVEVVCTMTEGPLAVGARHALAHAAAIYAVPHRLVLLPGFATAGERLRAALENAPDLPALVLGADVLPEGRGWLAFWLRRLRRQDALASALLAADGSIAATREGRDPCRGLPAQHLPASGRPVDRPLADCLALSTAGIARLLGSGAPHPDPALWIASALNGAARSETRFPFRRFGAAATPGAFAAALAEAEFALTQEDRE